MKTAVGLLSTRTSCSSSVPLLLAAGSRPWPSSWGSSVPPFTVLGLHTMLSNVGTITARNTNYSFDCFLNLVDTVAICSFAHFVGKMAADKVPAWRLYKQM